jgi:hypothetical protein
MLQEVLTKAVIAVIGVAEERRERGNGFFNQ